MSYRNKQRRKRPTANRRILRFAGGVFALNVLMLSVVVGLFVGYLMMNNRAAANGFAVRDLERQISELRDQNGRFDLEVVAMQAMNNVEQQVGELGFVPVDDLDYISSAPAVVAVK